MRNLFAHLKTIDKRITLGKRKYFLPRTLILYTHLCNSNNYTNVMI